MMILAECYVLQNIHLPIISRKLSPESGEISDMPNMFAGRMIARNNAKITTTRGSATAACVKKRITDSKSKES